MAIPKICFILFNYETHGSHPLYYGNQQSQTLYVCGPTPENLWAEGKDVNVQPYSLGRYSYWTEKDDFWEEIVHDTQTIYVSSYVLA